MSRLTHIDGGGRARMVDVTDKPATDRTAVSVACLTLFDMLKAVDRTMTIGDIAVTSKSGGRSGDWSRAGAGS